jgi:transcriptional regulator with XRE-family HTH domain
MEEIATKNGQKQSGRAEIVRVGYVSNPFGWALMLFEGRDQREGRKTMSTPRDTANLAPVTEHETRGQALKRRRLHHGIKSIRELAEKTAIDREAIGRAEKDEGSDSTYERLEAWFERFEEEVDDRADEAGDDGDQFEVHLSGLYGVREIVVKAPVSDMAKVEAMVERLLRGARETGQ